MKTIQVLALIALMTWTSVASFAQCADKGNRIFGFMRADFHPEKMTEKMVSGLSLNEEQATKLAQLNDKYAQHFSSIRQNEQLNFAQKVARFKPLIARKNADLQQILTVEQFEQYTAKREKRAAKRYAKYQERAANRPSVEERATKRSERMTKNLSLDAKQAKALKKSFIKTMQGLDAIMGNTSLTPLARAEKAAPILDAQKATIATILNDEQREKLAQLRAERCEKKAHKRAHLRNIEDPQAFAAEHTKRMSKHLNLDAAQQSKVEAINIALAKQLQQLKAEEGDRKNKHTKKKAIMDGHASALKNVLNAEQYAKFEARRQKRHEHREQMRK